VQGVGVERRAACVHEMVDELRAVESQLESDGAAHAESHDVGALDAKGVEQRRDVAGHALVGQRSIDVVGMAASVRASSGGPLVLLAGEAGSGKTTLLRELCSERGGLRSLGGCDALDTPRPLGPLPDVVAAEGGQLGAVVEEEGASPSRVAGALADDLRRRSPTILVLEDLHWADEATLDVVRLLARRLDSLPVLVVVTYRDDEIERTDAVRVLLGELAGRSVGRRVTVSALSLDAVAALAEGHDVDVELLHQRTGGNPFFVTEVLASGGAGVPATVRDAVLARVARLDDDARSLLDAVAVVPGGAEVWLLGALAGDGLGALERCLASGMLKTEGRTVGFRHEIARVAIESALPLDRAVDLHRAALGALTAVRRDGADPARLAHHAEMAGDADAVLSHAPAAAERAARVGLIARRRPSSNGRYVSPAGSTRSGVRNCWIASRPSAI
jgi:hypothetical protein